uniref:Uncharacterized protein n=1 Tax=Rhizophagus irregularis (strain DAOM 181602 / DAOM 197198 / MUCL 43194) TaxID=747089 RepID=U9TFA8_RHIID
MGSINMGSYDLRLSYICDTKLPLKSYAGSNRLGEIFYYLLDKKNLIVHTNDKKVLWKI